MQTSNSKAPNTGPAGTLLHFFSQDSEIAERVCLPFWNSDTSPWALTNPGRDGFINFLECFWEKAEGAEKHTNIFLPITLDQSPTQSTCQLRIIL